MPYVAIIIVNWNGKADTLECLRSLRQITDSKYQIAKIVVDNASSDGSVAAIHKEFRDAMVIKAKKNLGFTGGNNVGIDYALAHDADYVWMINNDTFVKKDALTSLLKVFDSEKVGMAGSKIYFAPGREFHKERYKKSERGKVLWYAGGLIDWQNMYASHRGVDEVDQGQFDRIEETPFITGCSMMVARRVFDRIGKLDDRFFLYLEDLDFSLRAARSGFKLLYVPGSLVWHKNAGSTDRPGHDLHQYYLTRNRLLVGMRWAPLRTKVALGREAIKLWLTGPPPKRQAVADALIGRFGDQYPWGK